MKQIDKENKFLLLLEEGKDIVIIPNKVNELEKIGILTTCLVSSILNYLKEEEKKEL